jgi:cell division protein FtsB
VTAGRRAAGARRLRLPVAALLAFAAVVLVSSLPVSALLTQHRQLASVAAALARARAADRSLSAQVKALGDTGTVDGLARADYGLVPAGQKAYVILPPAGASSSEVAGSGHVPLDTPPVVPGSAQARALAGLGGGSSPRGATDSGAGRGAGQGTGAGGPSSGGFWSRVVRTLEFWR